MSTRTSLINHHLGIINPLVHDFVLQFWLLRFEDDRHEWVMFIYAI